MIKTKLGRQIGLSPGHIVLDGDAAHPPPKGQSLQFSAHIYCGHMAGWIKMPLGREVGLGPSNTVLDGDPAPSSSTRGQSPQFLANGRMDQDRTWHGDGSRPRPHCARWGPSFSTQKRNTAPPNFGPCLLSPNGWMDQDATWYGGWPWPRRRRVRWGPSSP